MPGINCKEAITSVSTPIRTPDADGVSDFGWVHGHQGRAEDPETGLVQNRERVLHMGLGRFLQRDPKGYVDGPNSQQGLRGNPVSFKDPTGTRVWVLWAKDARPGAQDPVFGFFRTYRNSCERAARKIETDVTEAMWQVILAEGHVRWNGEKFTKSRDMYGSRIRREAESAELLSTAADLDGFVADVKWYNEVDKEPWDQTVAAVHGLWDKGKQQPMGKVVVGVTRYDQPEALEKIGKVADLVVSCYAHDNEDEAYAPVKGTGRLCHFGRNRQTVHHHLCPNEAGDCQSSSSRNSARRWTSIGAP